MKTALLLLSLAGSCVPAYGQVDLSTYTLFQTINLPTTPLFEASALTYNWDTQRLLVVPDSGAALVELSLSGTVLSQMSMSGFEDPEGITYLGNGLYAISEERQQRVYRFTYVPGGLLVRGTLQNAALGSPIGNEGIEGLSYEPASGILFAVKEKTPIRVLSTTINFKAGTATVSDLFDPTALGVADLADLCVLSTVPSLVGMPDENNLLLLSQQSARLLKVTRTGTILGQINLSGLADKAEGVTIDPDRTIYICDELPKLMIFRPPSPPACYANCDGSTGSPLLTGNDFVCFINAYAEAAAAANCDGSSGIPTLTGNDFVCFINAYANGCT